jgi:hypothetical protein
MGLALPGVLHPVRRTTAMASRMLAIATCMENFAAMKVINRTSIEQAKTGTQIFHER